LRWDQIGLPGLDAALPDWLALGLTLLYVVWMINLYNFMDGMDGFAGGMAVFGFGGLAVLGLIGQALPFAVTALVIAASSAGFLTRNFPPARIFLGDVGSSVLGLLAAAMTLWGADIGLFPLWVGWLLFSPFIIDATWTLLRRIVQRRTLLACPSLSSLSTPGARGLGASAHAAAGLCRHGRRCRERGCRARHAGAGAMAVAVGLGRDLLG
jgi:UDP-N-acetylmuramyl pentapeptide phosphotransferase/UDP-N-acetylglucosamine-1-phosphate transferase